LWLFSVFLGFCRLIRLIRYTLNEMIKSKTVWNQRNGNSKIICTRLKGKSAYQPSCPSGRCLSHVLSFFISRFILFYLVLSRVLVTLTNKECIYSPAPSSRFLSYMSGWREALWEQSVSPKNTTQCPWKGLKPGPLNQEVNTLTILGHHTYIYRNINMCIQ